MHDDDPDALPFDPGALAALADQVAGFFADGRATFGEDESRWPACKVAYYVSLGRAVDCKLQANLQHMRRHGWMPAPPPYGPHDPHDRPDPDPDGP